MALKTLSAAGGLDLTPGPFREESNEVAGVTLERSLDEIARECGEGCPQNLNERSEGPRRSGLAALTDQHRLTSRLRASDERAQQGGLADPRIAGDQHQSPIPPGGPSECGVEHRQPRTPPDQLGREQSTLVVLAPGGSAPLVGSTHLGLHFGSGVHPPAV